MVFQSKVFVVYVVWIFGDAVRLSIMDRKKVHVNVADEFGLGELLAGRELVKVDQVVAFAILVNQSKLALRLKDYGSENSVLRVDAKHAQVALPGDRLDKFGQESD